MKIKCKICDRYINNKPCPYLHTKLELERASKRTSLERLIVINSNLRSKYARNEGKILILNVDIDKINDLIETDAAEKNRQGARFNTNLSSLCPECGRIGEPIDDPALSWKCPQCGRIYRVKDPEGIARLKAGAHSDDNKINEGGRSQ